MDIENILFSYMKAVSSFFIRNNRVHVFDFFCRLKKILNEDSLYLLQSFIYGFLTNINGLENLIMLAVSEI